MSGFEIAGIVLGGFPILVKCLGHYQEAFEPLEEWWNFRTKFVAFIDDVRHQMMRYNENMIRLLDPIIADTDDLNNLVQDSNLLDPRWRNGSLDELLKQRLGSESDRFLRILGRMKGVMDELGSLLQIENGKVCRPSRESLPSPSSSPSCPNFSVRQVVTAALMHYSYPPSSFIKLLSEETLLLRPLTQQVGLLGGRIATKALGVALDTSPNQFLLGQAQEGTQIGGL
jgi:hypothetical protein